MKAFLKKICFAATFLIFIANLTACASKSTNPTPTSIPPITLEEAQADYHAGNYDNALQKLTILAINGNNEAQYALGYMYYHGLGTSQNIDIARGWFREAAATGYQQAQQALNELDRPVSSAFPDFSPDL